MDPIAELLRAYNAAEGTGTVSDEIVDLAERWDASTPGEANPDAPDAPVLRVYDDGVAPLTEDELTQLSDGLTALADDDEAGVTIISAAADVVSEVGGELATIGAMAEAEEADLAAARARLRGETDDPEANGDDDAEDDPADGDTDEADADGESTDSDAADESAADADAPEPVMAAAARRSSLAALARRSSGSRRNRPPARAAAAADSNRITFASGLEGFAAGQRGRDGQPYTPADIDAAVAERFEAFAGSSAFGGGAENVRVARIQGNFPEERRLVDDRGRSLSAADATDRIAAVFQAGRDLGLSRQAAGGFCAPAQPIYTVNIMGTTVRPIRDTALTSFEQTRGRVLSLIPPRLQAVLPSAGVWTAEMDEDAVDDDEVRKTFLRVVCGDEIESEVQAVYSGLIYGEMLARTYGEWNQAWFQLARVAHAQKAEVELWERLWALATPVANAPVVLSATRDLVNYIARLAWHIRLRNREMRNFPFRFVTSSTVLDIIAEDLAVSAFGDNHTENLQQAEQILSGALAARNINVTYSPDIQVPNAQTEDATAVAYPSSLPFALYPEGWAIHLDNGTLDIGVIRDKALVEANDVATFMETFEGVHMLGARSDARRGRFLLCPNGSVYGFTDPEGRCSGLS